MHGYEYNIFTGKLEKMKSWRKDSSWVEQNAQWRYSDDLKTYRVHLEKERVFIELA
jgi:nitrite reductase/ring-hydroxylating ferredoxin subunit